MYYFHTYIAIIFISTQPDTESEAEEVDQDESQALDEESTPWEGTQNAEAGELSITVSSFYIILSVTFILWLIFHHISSLCVKAKATKPFLKVKTIKHVVKDDPADLSVKCILVQI